MLDPFVGQIAQKGSEMMELFVSSQNRTVEGLESLKSATIVKSGAFCGTQSASLTSTKLPVVFVRQTVPRA